MPQFLMTLIRRVQKHFLQQEVGTDIENRTNPSSSILSTTFSHAILEAESTDRSLFWSLFRMRSIWRRYWITTFTVNRSRTYCCVIFPLFLTTVVTVSKFPTVFRFSIPPGKNYLDPNYWRRSHSISLQQARDLRKRFPIRIDINNTDEMESVYHPGYLLADTKLMEFFFRGNLETNLTVPKFWDPVDAFGEFEGGIREFLGDWGRYLITPTEASVIGSLFDEKQTIFLSVASYRDPECLPSVESAFKRAKNPERLRVAVIDQRSEDQSDASCRPPSENLCRTSSNNILCDYIGQIDYVEYPSQLMVGPIFARHIANRMYRGEYFAMQIDAHVRFVANWDEDIIDQWNSTGNEMAVISTYMNNLEKNSMDPETHESLKFTRSMMCEYEYEWNPGPMTHIKFNMQPNRVPKVTDSPMLQPFWAAGFSFGRGHFLVSVPYDNYLPFVFQGEEILQTIRGFSFGYDFYAPLRNVAFHMYALKENKEERLKIPKYTENAGRFGHEAKKQAYLRLIGISGTSDPSLAYFNLEEERYGLGFVRSRELFFDVFGIYPSNNTFEQKLCQFVRGSMHSRFKKFLRFDKMGVDYSRVQFRYRYIEESSTKIDEKELASLQARLKELLEERKNSTVNERKETALVSE